MFVLWNVFVIKGLLLGVFVNIINFVYLKLFLFLVFCVIFFIINLRWVIILRLIFDFVVLILIEEYSLFVDVNVFGIEDINFFVFLL